MLKGEMMPDKNTGQNKIMNSNKVLLEHRHMHAHIYTYMTSKENEKETSRDNMSKKCERRL